MTRQQITIIGIVVIAIAVVLVVIIGLGPTFSTSKTTKAPSQEAQASGGSVIGKTAPGEKIIILSKLGMVWISCRAAVGSALKKVDGVISYYVDSKKDQATVKYEIKRTNPEIIKQAIIKGGYKVGGIKELEN